MMNAGHAVNSSDVVPTDSRDSLIESKKGTGLQPSVVADLVLEAITHGTKYVLPNVHRHPPGRADNRRSGTDRSIAGVTKRTSARLSGLLDDWLRVAMTVAGVLAATEVAETGSLSPTKRTSVETGAILRCGVTGEIAKRRSER